MLLINELFKLFQSFTPVTDTDFDFNAVPTYLTASLFFCLVTCNSYGLFSNKHCILLGKM